jgi:hypothetical protein
MSTAEFHSAGGRRTKAKRSFQKWPNDPSSHKIFCAVSEDFLGGTGKAEAAKLPGAGISLKQCPEK